MGRIFFPVPIGPEAVEGESAVVSDDFLVIDQFVNGVGGPFGFQDNGMFEYFVLSEMENHAQVVKVVAEKVGTFGSQAELFAYPVIVVQGDVVPGVLSQGFADFRPGCRYSFRQVGHRPRLRRICRTRSGRPSAVRQLILWKFSILGYFSFKPASLICFRRESDLFMTMMTGLSPPSSLTISSQ